MGVAIGTTATAGPAFWLLATAIVAAALGVVLLRNMVQSALCLGLVLLLVGGLYLNLQADMLAGFQVLIYVGAVVTLILIGIMLIQNIAARNIIQTNHRWGMGVVVSGLAFVLFAWALSSARWPAVTRPVEVGEQVRQLSLSLLDTYLLPFEVASVLLLVALIGAIVIAQQTEDREGDQ